MPAIQSSFPIADWERRFAAALTQAAPELELAHDRGLERSIGQHALRERLDGGDVEAGSARDTAALQSDR